MREPRAMLESAKELLERREWRRVPDPLFDVTSPSFSISSPLSGTFNESMLNLCGRSRIDICSKEVLTADFTFGCFFAPMSVLSSANAV